MVSSRQVIQCPFMDATERCSIYARRPLCCRSFPVSGGYCTSSGRCSEDCRNCKDKCCKHIVVDRPMSPDELLEYLNMDCTTCMSVNWESE